MKQEDDEDEYGLPKSYRPRTQQQQQKQQKPEETDRTQKQVVQEDDDESIGVARFKINLSPMQAKQLLAD